MTSYERYVHRSERCALVFLTWFEYAPTDAEAFEELVGMQRETEEWTYVEREVDIRLAWLLEQV